jgi:hypothetical protein
VNERPDSAASSSATRFRLNSGQQDAKKFFNSHCHGRGRLSTTIIIWAKDISDMLLLARKRHGRLLQILFEWGVSRSCLS